MLKSLIKLLPLQTILGFLFPAVAEKLTAFQAEKTPENGLALGEAVAEAAIGEFDPAIMPEVIKAEGAVGFVFEPAIAFSKAQTLDTEAALAAGFVEAVKVYAPNTPEESLQNLIADIKAILAAYKVQS